MCIKKYDIVYVKDRGWSRYGNVQKFSRPAIVLQNNKGNHYSPTTIVAFITSQIKREEMLTHVILQGYALEKKSMVLLEQIATVAQEDIERKIDTLRVLDRVKIDSAMLVSLGMIDIEGA